MISVISAPWHSDHPAATSFKVSHLQISTFQHFSWHQVLLWQPSYTWQLHLIHFQQPLPSISKQVFPWIRDVKSGWVKLGKEISEEGGPHVPFLYYLKQMLSQTHILDMNITSRRLINKYILLCKSVLACKIFFSDQASVKYSLTSWKYRQTEHTYDTRGNVSWYPALKSNNNHFFAGTQLPFSSHSSLVHHELYRVF